MWNFFKKTIKITFYTFLVVGILIGLLAYFNQDKILAAFQKKADDLLATKVDVKDIRLELIEDFPNISIKLDEPIVFDAIPGSIDTFIVAKSIYCSLDILTLMQGEYAVNKVSLEEGRINIKIDKEGYNNYTIFKPDTTKKGGSFSFDLESISFRDVHIHYIDQRINNNHRIHAQTLEAEMSVSDQHFNIDLDGELFSKHLGIKGQKYLEEKEVLLDCELEFLQASKKLVVHPSSITIGQSKFNVAGSYINNSDNTTHMVINGNKTNIQTILTLLPNTASKKLKEYQSEGQVYFNGKIDGNINAKESPSIEFEFGFNEASFYHPATKQKIEGASLKGHYTNGASRSTKTSELQLKEVVGKIGNGTFKGDFLYRNFDAPYLKMNLNADLDVAKIEELYPVDEIDAAKGRFVIKSSFDGLLSDLKKDTRKVKSNGSLAIKDASFVWKANKLVYKGINGDFMFNNNDLGITNFSCTAGDSKFELNGFFKNFVAYLFLEDVHLKMEAGLNSPYLDLDQLLSADKVATEKAPSEGGEPQQTNYRLNVSEKLDFDIDCHVKEVKFREFKGKNTAKNISGDLHLRNQVLSFNQLKTDIAGGSLYAKGKVNLKDTTNYVAQISGEVKGVEVKNAFQVFENFGQNFITDKQLSGRLEAVYSTKMYFDNSLAMQNDKLVADVDMVMDNGKISGLDPLEELGFFMRRNKYDKYLKDNDLRTVEFSQLKNSFHVENKVISIPEMEIKSSSADFNIRGTHSFNNDIDYYVSIPIINYKRRADREEAGIRRNKNTGEFFIYIQLLGTVDDFEFNIDKKHTVETAKEKIVNEIINVIKPKDDEDDFIQLDVEDTLEMIDFSD